MSLRALSKKVRKIRYLLDGDELARRSIRQMRERFKGSFCRYWEITQKITYQLKQPLSLELLII
jgi:hypothetical protein